jgi:rhamnose transport system substrate-binding protein
MKKMLLMTTALAMVALSSNAFAANGAATPGKALRMVLLPKFSGNAVFDQAHVGALEAQKELQNPTELQFLAPPASNAAGQIEIVTNATTQGVNAIMISNNIGDQIGPAVKAACVRTEPSFHATASFSRCRTGRTCGSSRSSFCRAMCRSI